MLQIFCDFPDTAKFHAKYQRNNKRTGLKNLRCYPYCGPDDKHHENGFCGSAVRAVVSINNGGNAEYDINRLCAWGELISKSEFPPRFPVGSVFTRQEIRRVLRTDTQHLNPLFEAHSSAAEGNSRQFSFESHKKGWHYEWKGNKYTSDKPHAFVIYIAVPFAAESYQCIGVFYSPVFTMFCRRRHKTVPEAEKSQLASPVPDEERTISLRLGPNGKIPVADRPAPTALPQPRVVPSPASSDDEDDDSMSNDSERPRRSGTRGKKTPVTSSRSSAKPTFKRPVRGAASGSSLPKKPKADKDGTDLKLMRVLAAISNLDKLKRRLQQDLAKKHTSLLQSGSMSPSASMVQTSMTDDDLDMAWLDALTGPLQENLFGAEDFAMPFKGGSVADIFDLVEPQEEVNQERIRAVEVVEELARFLVDEESFTAAIHECAATKASYSDFLQLVQKQIGDFLWKRFNGMTVDDLDCALRGESPMPPDENHSRKEMKSAFETLVSAALMRDADEGMDRTTTTTTTTTTIPAIASSTALAMSEPTPKSQSHISSPSVDESADANYPSKIALEQASQQSNGSSSMNNTTGSSNGNSAHQYPTLENKPIQLPPGLSMTDFLKPPKPLLPTEDPDVAGVWIRPDHNTAEMEKWRERRDMDWVQRQLIAKMEKRFEMEQLTRGQVVVRLSRKLLSSGVLTYQLDGIERPFPLSSPLGPSAQLATRTVAWAIGPCVCFMNFYSDKERLLRCIWKVGEDELHGIHFYQARGGVWEHDRDAPESQFPVSEGGWKVVHMTTQVCARDKTMTTLGRMANSTSSEAEMDDA